MRIACTLPRNQMYKFSAKSNGAEAAAGRDKWKCLVQVKPSEPQSDIPDFRQSENTINISILDHLDAIVPGPARGYGGACSLQTL